MRISKHKQMQAMIRLYREETGIAEVDMRDVVPWAVRKGWQLPPPTSPLDRLIAEFSQAAREEIRHDAVTHLPYRANHAYPYKQGKHGQLYLWIDIDTAPRLPMVKSLVNRREQIVDDAVALTYDAEHWNRINPADEPIVMQLDFNDDVEWRRNSDENKRA